MAETSDIPVETAIKRRVAETAYNRPQERTCVLEIANSSPAILTECVCTPGGGTFERLKWKTEDKAASCLSGFVQAKDVIDIDWGKVQECGIDGNLNMKQKCRQHFFKAKCEFVVHLK
ncbi:hypothetical protein CAPTEDRAFT_189325 [Capitella teleta]|uniref:Uncharacterized protein n=1 Tax=Capitella teleta TaxID=283909 RepID=R7UKS0_CAPTE|nr:hypothetical protein CAPTEDRAFT_189325 [Capitella teleta]|eukprot:ELU06693.1 hypothetical protein CAPTEDRAFT_189325 [Capitella teleta]